MTDRDSGGGGMTGATGEPWVGGDERTDQEEHF